MTSCSANLVPPTKKHIPGNSRVGLRSARAKAGAEGTEEREEGSRRTEDEKLFENEAKGERSALGLEIELKKKRDSPC